MPSRLRTARSEGIAFLGFIERQKNLVRRYWAWEAVWLVYSMVSVLSIGFLASGLGALGGRFDLRQAQLYLLIGSVLWGYMSLVFFEIAYAIGWERWEGTIEHTFMAPVRRATHLVGICAFSMLYGLVRTAVVLADGAPGQFGSLEELFFERTGRPLQEEHEDEEVVA